MTIYKSSELSISVLLIFEPLMNSALFLKANFLSYALSLWICNSNSSFTNNICITVMSICSIDVLNLICLLGLYLFSAFQIDHKVIPTFINDLHP